MKARIFQPFQKVWSPRTPDSGYDSLGLTIPPSPIVLVPLISETLNTSLILASGAYFAATALSGAAAAVGCSTRFKSGTYTA
jgi:hypothetical protein